MVFRADIPAGSWGLTIWIEAGLLQAEYFTQRREMGVMNLGGAGQIVVEGQAYAMEKRDTLIYRARFTASGIQQQ